MMKSFLVIGMSTLGCHLVKYLSELNCEIMIADENEELVEEMMPYAVTAKIADCSKPEVLKSFGVPDFDTCFVCLGGHFSDAMEITYLLKELGAKKIISEVNRDIEKKFLLLSGADETVYPEQDMAQRLAESESNDSVFDAIRLSGEYSVFEVLTPKVWYNKTVRDVDVRNKHRLSIVAVKQEGKLLPMLSPEYKFNANDHLMVLGHPDDIKKITSK